MNGTEANETTQPENCWTNSARRRPKRGLSAGPYEANPPEDRLASLSSGVLTTFT